MTKKVKVSIIIPEWNRIEEMKKCLGNIMKQNYLDYEVIVVDNGSTDGTKEMIKKDFPKVKIILLKKNVGAARARNIGILEAKGKYVWFLDSDAFPVSKSCLRNMIKILESEPTIGQLGGEIIDGKIRIPNSYRNQDGLFIFKENCLMEDVECINTSNCIMRKDLIEKVGGFDPDYFYGYEDNNVSFLIKKLGYRCVVDNSVLAVHERSLKSRASTFYLWNRNRIRFVFLKENLLFILFLPLIDIYTTLKLLPEKIRIIKESKVVSKKNQEDGVIKTGLAFGLSMIKAYIWIILNIPKILYIRTTKPNFLENENKNKGEIL